MRATAHGVTAALAGLLAGGLYWQAISTIGGVTEPWDDGAYWRFWYPLALLICGVFGYVLRRNGWLAGSMLIVAQLPVMWLNGQPGPLWMVGLLLTLALAVPAVAISFGSALLAARRRAA